MGQRLARIRETTNGQYRVTFERATGTSDVVADFVVLALPFAVLNEVDISGAGFNALKHQAIADQGRGHKSPLFRASYSFYKVGQYTTFGGYERVRQGGVLFCGEHTSIEFQGFMEGAASEGRRAARQLARLLAGD